MTTLPRMADGGGVERRAGRDGPGHESFWRRYLRRTEPSCAGCGYGLSGLEEPRCPECGRLHSLAELSHQANFESEAWYLAAGWGLFASGVLAIPVGFALLASGIGGLAGGDLPGGGVALAGGLAALGMPMWAGSWLKRWGARITASWGAARWLVVGFCWLAILPLVGVAVSLAMAFAKWVMGA